MNKKGKERTGFIVRNIKTEKRDAQNGGADKMGNVKMISPAVPNMPAGEAGENRKCAGVALQGESDYWKKSGRRGGKDF